MEHRCDSDGAIGPRDRQRRIGFRAEEAVFRQTLVKSIDNDTGTQSLRYAVSRTTVPVSTP